MLVRNRLESPNKKTYVTLQHNSEVNNNGKHKLSSSTLSKQNEQEKVFFCDLLIAKKKRKKEMLGCSPLNSSYNLNWI